MTIVGDAPLMVNNKMSVAYLIAEKYDGGPGKSVNRTLQDRTIEEQYKDAFYVLLDSKYSAPHPDGRYGVPLSGISKCIKAAVRSTGISDNTQVGNIQKAFQLEGGIGGMCLIRHKGFEMDTRPVNIGSGQKTVPSLRYRPIFHEWEIDLQIRFNPINISPEMILNLTGFAGAYIGLCELRAQKGQGQCGGFKVLDGSVSTLEEM